MPPKGSRKAPPTMADAVMNKNSLLSSFFKPLPSMPTAGRPAGVSKRSRGGALGTGRPRGATSSTRTEEQQIPQPPQVVMNEASAQALEAEQQADDQESADEKRAGDNKHGRKEKRARVNWSKRDNLARLTTDGGERLVWEDWRTELGAHAGKPSLLSKEEQGFVVDVLRRRDRANDGMNPRKAANMVQDIVLTLGKQQAADVLRQTISPNNKDKLTNITVDKAYGFVRECNTGRTPDGRSFGEVMAHFIFGGDETCFLASAGDVRIIGDKEKKKHEAATANSRVSTTLYHLGSAAGATGPTAFLPPGVRLKQGYSEAFLVKHGAAPGSTIAMTPTGYMCEEAWVQIAPKMAKGIREVNVSSLRRTPTPPPEQGLLNSHPTPAQLPIVCDMPDWWVVCFIDGFGPHTSNVDAMEIYEIILVKEQGDTSHVCQAYDQEVAEGDKSSMRQTVSCVSSSLG
ncbi:MAG: hypothetical protein SGPRY_007531 [Prymnesium sp.]